jgi:hypothetical protein
MPSSSESPSASALSRSAFTWRLSGSGRDARWLLRVVFRTALLTAAAFLLFGGTAAGFGQRAAIYAVQLSVLLLVWVRVGKSLRNPRQRILLRGIRPRHFLVALLILTCTGAAIAVLLAGDTFLRWGWWSVLGGNGNVILGEAKASGQILSDLILPILILTPLLLSLARFALQEERIFRRGDEKRGIGGRLSRSLAFGLAHLLMGIPIGAAIGLGVGGFGFSQVYLRRWRKSASRYQSVLDAARVHLAYNLIVISSAIAVLIVAEMSGS